MANNTSQKGVLVLDTAADNIVAAGTPVKIAKARFVHPTAAGAVTVTDAGGTVAKLELAAVAGGADESNFLKKPFTLDGLKIIAISAGGVLYLYSE